MGTTASTDGQFYPAARQGEAMDTINSRYGNDPGIKAYPRQNDFAAALREVGRIERALFIIEGIVDTGMQRCPGRPQRFSKAAISRRSF